MKEARPIPKMETEKRIIRGQTTYLSGRSPLRCYYYAKLGPKWNSADRVVYGMRWNAYVSSGKATPFFRPLEPDTLAHSAPKTRSIFEEEKKGVERKERRDSHSRKEEPRRKEETRRTGHRSAASRKADEPASNIVSITRHAGFRHLRLVSSPATEPVAATLIPMGRNARHVAGREERPEPRTHAPAAQASIPFVASTQSLSQISSAAGEEGIAFSAHLEAGHAAAFISTDPVSSPHAVKTRPPSIVPAEKTGTARAAAAVQPFSFLLRVPENDNARPGGFDDPQRMPAPGFTPQVFFCASSVPAGKGIGYISSGRRRVLQLKTAIGAAMPAQ